MTSGIVSPIGVSTVALIVVLAAQLCAIGQATQINVCDRVQPIGELLIEYDHFFSIFIFYTSRIIDEKSYGGILSTTIIVQISKRHILCIHSLYEALKVMLDEAVSALS